MNRKSLIDKLLCWLLRMGSVLNRSLTPCSFLKFGSWGGFLAGSWGCFLAAFLVLVGSRSSVLELPRSGAGSVLQDFQVTRCS